MKGGPRKATRWEKTLTRESCSHLSDLKEDLEQINIQIQKHSIPRIIHWKEPVQCRMHGQNLPLAVIQKKVVPVMLLARYNLCK